MTRWLLLTAVASTVLLAGDRAEAQTCTQPTSGVARVGTAGVAVTVRMVGATPLVNDVTCGFAATSIQIVGTAANDRVTLRTIPATVPVSTDLMAGTDTVNWYGTAANESMKCTATAVDRDGNGTADLTFGASFIEALSIYGGAGNDGINCTPFAIKVKLYGEAGNDALRGTNFADSLVGGPGNDNLFGLGGNDNLDGGPGDDDERGGAGQDTYNQGNAPNGDDYLDGGADRDVVSYAARTAGVLAGAGAAEDAIAATIEVVTGGKGNDTIDFSTSNSPKTLNGGTGNDLIIGTAMADTLNGNAGNDTLVGNTGNDKLFGEAGNDSLDGGAGKDSFDAGADDDDIAATEDGLAEVINCGTGTDTYVPIAEDTFNACETGIGPVARSRVAGGGGHTCAILDDDSVRCWGTGFSGQLGRGDTGTYGDGPGEMGANLPAVALGTGRTAVALAAGTSHTCAVLDNGQAKCWGTTDGLGLGDLEDRGDEPGEMGNALPAVELGTGRTAVSIAAGSYHTCALLDNASIKCWGGNIIGELGLGNLVPHGNGPGEMGDALPAVDLGTGRTAVAVTAGDFFTCALLDNGQVKCFGLGIFGQLGSGGEDPIGGFPGEMGDALAPVDLGTDRTAVAIDSSGVHTCAVLDNGAVKCWGRNDFGNLGVGDAEIWGDEPGEMGDALPAVDLGAGRTATAIGVSWAHSCAVLDNGGVKCWGGGGFLGQGDNVTRGDDPGELGNALPAIALGTGRTALDIAVGEFHSCATLDNATVKCWGRNNDAQLGLGDTSHRGNAPGQMGNALPAVNLPGTVTP